MEKDPPERRQTRYASRPSRLVHSTPFYYGWVIVAIGATGGIMTNPGQTPGFSAFLNHFIADLGLRRSVVSTLYTAATLTASLFLPWVGRLFDRPVERQAHRDDLDRVGVRPVAAGRLRQPILDDVVKAIDLVCSPARRSVSSK